MEYRILGKTGFKVSALSLGTWQVGGKWGSTFNANNAQAVLEAALEHGINFVDTADVYSDGDSERAVGKAIKAVRRYVFVATKCGRNLDPHTNEGYTPKAIRKFVDGSLQRLGLETLDLIQLHCPPNEVYYRPEIFGLFEDLRSEGKIQNLGVSVEKIEQGLKAIEYPNVATVQIVFNMFRQRPAELFFEQAQKKNVGVIVRVPLASGLLSGKFDPNSSFSTDDHRNFNRQGEAFDKGETFAGVDYETGLEAVNELKALFPGVMNLSPLALKWILDHEAVSTVIPGASSPEHIRSNLSSLELDEFTADQVTRIKGIYRMNIKPQVHHLW